MRGPSVIPLELLKETKPGATEPKTFGADVITSPPPKGWTDSSYDDSFWARSRGPFIDPSGTYERYVGDYWAGLYLRGKFEVKDVKGVRKMFLSAKYRGGLVVYLNGTEVARQHMPKGELSADALAEPYPQDAYVDAAGKLIPEPRGVAGRIKKGDKDFAARVATRDAHCAKEIELPTKLLKKGVNVLAIKIRRSAYRPEALKWKTKWGLCREGWSHSQLSSLRLAADADTGAIVSNVSRPNGTHVWNQDIHKSFTIEDFADPNEPLRPIKLIGVRNGFYSGQVVVGSTSTLKDLKATVSNLTQVGGKGRIPISHVKVRYAGPPIKQDWQRYNSNIELLSETPTALLKPSVLLFNARDRKRHGLGEKPATQAAVQPIWVTVHVSSDASAGMYKGTLQISADGMTKTEVPVKLEIIDWTLPDAGDYRVFIGLNQSPATLSMFYNVPMWSKKHWDLLEKSWRIQGYVGNNLLVIPLVTKTQYGNEESLVRWIKQGDGTYKYDFTTYDRLVGLAAKYCKIKIVSYQVYLSGGSDEPGGEWGVRPPDKPTFVTVLDPKTGKCEPMKLPAYNTDEAKKLWKPFAAALQERHKKLGIEKGLRTMFGVSGDCGVHKEVVAHFKNAWPAANWHYGAHGRGVGAGGKGNYIKFMEYLYVPARIPPHDSKRKRLWWTPHPNGTLIAMSQRARYQPPMTIRTMAERSMLLGDHGASRMGMDLWPVIKGKKGYAGGSVYNRWLTSTCAQRAPHLRCLALPGKDGPASSVKIEAMREGRQEAEARGFIELAVVNKKITGDLAVRCKTLLDQRYQLCRIAHIRKHKGPIARFSYNEGWQKRSADLYRLAAEVARSCTQDGESRKATTSAKVQRILCFGDSITSHGRWVKAVGQSPLFETVNAGRGGRQTKGAKKALASYLRKHANLDRIIMFLGVNDLPARNKRPGNVKVADCVRNMGEAIDLALRHFKPKDVILVAPCGVNPDLMGAGVRKKGYHITQPLLVQLEAKYKSLARKKGVSFFSLLNVVGQNNYRDGLHPNKAGDAEITQAVLEFLTK